MQCILEHYEDELNCPVCGTISHPTTPEKYLIKDEVLSQVINEIIPLKNSNKDSKSPLTSTNCNVRFSIIYKFLNLSLVFGSFFALKQTYRSPGTTLSLCFRQYAYECPVQVGWFAQVCFFDIENRDLKFFKSSHVSFIFRILAFQSYLIYY